MMLEHLAMRIVGLHGRAIVAIDGVDGSGKTTFADRLTTLVERHGREVLRASVDSFHNPRATRYRRGRGNPQGFFLDSYDYDALRTHLIEPFRCGAEEVSTARFDHQHDQAVDVTYRVGASSILLLDGIFLHRDELCGSWDYSVFLSVPFTVSYARMARRDGSDPDPLAPENRRYYEGQNIYLKTCRPELRASLVIDNSDDVYAK